MYKNLPKTRPNLQCEFGFACLCACTLTIHEKLWLTNTKVYITHTIQLVINVYTWLMLIGIGDFCLITSQCQCCWYKLHCENHWIITKKLYISQIQISNIIVNLYMPASNVTIALCLCIYMLCVCSSSSRVCHVMFHGEGCLNNVIHFLIVPVCLRFHSMTGITSWCLNVIIKLFVVIDGI